MTGGGGGGVDFRSDIRFNPTFNPNLQFEPGALTQGNIGALTQGDIGGLTQGDIGGLTQGNIGGLAQGNIGGLTQGDIGGLTQGDIGGLTQGDIGGLTQGDIGGLSQGDIGAITQGSLGDLLQGSIGGLQQGDIGGITQGSLGDLIQGSLGALTQGDIGGLTQGSVGDIILRELFGDITQGDIGGLTQGSIGDVFGPTYGAGPAYGDFTGPTYGAGPTFADLIGDVVQGDIGGLSQGSLGDLLQGSIGDLIQGSLGGLYQGDIGGITDLIGDLTQGSIGDIVGPTYDAPIGGAGGLGGEGGVGGAGGLGGLGGSVVFNTPEEQFIGEDITNLASYFIDQFGHTRPADMSQEVFEQSMYEKAAEQLGIRAPSFEEPEEEDLSYLPEGLSATEVAGKIAPQADEEILEYLRPDTGLEQIPELQEAFQDLVTGKTVPGAIEDIMTQLELDQELALDERKAALRMRGILPSTPGEAELDRLKARQAATRATTQLQGITGLAPLYEAMGSQVFGQGMGVENTAFDQFMRLIGTQQGLDTSQRAEQNQALSMLINALSGEAVTPQMPGFQMPGASPGMVESLGKLGGNIIGSDPQGSLEWIKKTLGL